MLHIQLFVNYAWSSSIFLPSDSYSLSLLLYKYFPVRPSSVYITWYIVKVKLCLNIWLHTRIDVPINLLKY